VAWDSFSWSSFMAALRTQTVSSLPNPSTRYLLASVKIGKNDDLLGLVLVMVIDSLGEVLGEMNSADALRLAQEQGLDLVEVNPKAKPPVCKILDLGEFMDPVKVAQR
jgi:hypothetical protein